MLFTKIEKNLPHFFQLPKNAYKKAFISNLSDKKTQKHITKTLISDIIKNSSKKQIIKNVVIL